MPSLLRIFFSPSLLGLLGLFGLLGLLFPNHNLKATPVIQHWQTSSGSRVYFVPTEALPILDVQIDFPAGTAYDPPGKAGVAGLVSSLLDAGTSKLSEEQIAERWVDLGARYSAHTDNDRAKVSLRTLLSHQDDALELLQQLLNQASFPEKVIKREKARSIVAIREANTRPDVIADKKFAETIYPQHPYGVSASEKSVGSINRYDLLNFKKLHYTGNNATVSMVGAIKRKQAEQIAEMLTAQLPLNEKVANLPKVNLPVGQTINIPHPASQSHIRIGLPAVRRGDTDYFPLLVGNYTLGGGGFVSRLMQEVREKKGYAYSVYSYFYPQQRLGAFEIGLQTKREQAEAALQLSNSVLHQFLRDGPSEIELEAAKKNLTNSLALRIDSNAKLLRYVAMIAFYRLPLTYLDDFAQNVNTVTRQQVQEAFTRHINPANLVTLVVAPQ